MSVNLFEGLDWSNWIKGVWASVVGGGSNAVVAGLGLNLIDPNHFNAHTGDFYKMVGALFAFNGTVSFFMYLKQNPMPVTVQKTTVTVETTKTPDTAKGKD